jgi:uncharacterized protein (TIGR02466 family)
MPLLDPLFVTRIYQAPVEEAGLLDELDAACRSIAEDDAAGQRWCEKNGYPGYTSYASLDDLPWRVPAFKRLARQLDRHVAAFAKELDYDLGRRKLVLDALWINVLPPGGMHGSHLHPLSVVSGTFYVAVPEGAGAIKFEDPRLGLMMAAPPRKPKARADNRPFATIAPTPGTVLLWEAFLRHEVPLNEAEEDRISVSFNYAWR